MLVWKILVGGEGGVGKTAVINRYINDTFEMDMKMTIGVAFVLKDVRMEGVDVRLQIWDMGGQDRFRFILPSYCKGAYGGFILYDASDLETLEATGEWFSMFKKHDPAMPVVLVGTKIDLIASGEMDRVKGVADKISSARGCAGSILTSSKLGINVNEAMGMLLRHMIARSG